MALGQRLKEARKLAGLTQERLAELVGMTQAAIGALEKRDSQRSNKAAELAEALGVSLLWLVSGSGPMLEEDARKARQEVRQHDSGYRWESLFFDFVRESLAAGESIEALFGISEDEYDEVTEGGLHVPDWLLSRVEIEGFPESGTEPHTSRSPQADDAREQRSDSANELEFFGHMDAWDSKTPLDEDEVELPLFREVELAAGGGATQVIENHGAKLRFAKSTLRRAGVPAESAACAFVRGNSMDPVMPDGTCVGVNTADKAIKDGEIYAIDHGGMLRVKYLHRRPGGGIKIVSQNASEHPVEEVTAEDMAANVRVIGRVFWWSVLR